MIVGTIIIISAFLLIFGAFIVKDIAKKRKKGEKYQIKQCVSAYLMLSPALILAVLFVLLPIIYSLGYAFTDFYLLEPENIKFIGLKNFKDIGIDIKNRGDMFNAIINTGKFVIGVVPLQIGLALGLALLVNRKKKLTGLYKIMYFAPVVISLTVTSYLWLQILSPNEGGMINSFLVRMGLKPRDFLGNEKTAMLWIILISAWQGCGYQMLIFLSGLSNIRKELYEAAELDGAGVWRLFFNITLPGLRSTLVFIIITVFIGACKVMVQPMLMTGKQSYTITLNYYMYIQGYSYRWIGYSSAVALLMTVVIGGITFLQRRLMREKD